MILIILFTQYVLAGLLTTRRLLSNTAATVDTAMFFMVLSGLTTLTQSLIISLINQSWIRSPSPASTEPCITTACHLPECMAFRVEQSLPNDDFTVNVFGFNIVGIPWIMLHELAGGNLQLTILQNQKSVRNTWWHTTMALLGIYHIWRLLIHMAVHASHGRKFLRPLLVLSF